MVKIMSSTIANRMEQKLVALEPKCNGVCIDGKLVL